MVIGFTQIVSFHPNACRPPINSTIFVSNIGDAQICQLFEDDELSVLEEPNTQQSPVAVKKKWAVVHGCTVTGDFHVQVSLLLMVKTLFY